MNIKTIILASTLTLFITPVWGATAPSVKTEKKVEQQRPRPVEKNILSNKAKITPAELPSRISQAKESGVTIEDMAIENNNLGHKQIEKRGLTVEQIQINDSNINLSKRILAIAMKVELKDRSEYIPNQNDLLIILFRNVPGELPEREVLAYYNCNGNLNADILECKNHELGYLDPTYEYAIEIYPQDDLVITPHEYFYEAVDEDDEFYAIQLKAVAANHQKCFATKSFPEQAELSECDSYTTGFRVALKIK